MLTRYAAPRPQRGARPDRARARSAVAATAAGSRSNALQRPRRDALEGLRVEVGTEFALEHVRHLAVERRGRPARVVEARMSRAGSSRGPCRRRTARRCAGAGVPQRVEQQPRLLRLRCRTRRGCPHRERGDRCGLARKAFALVPSRVEGAPAGPVDLVERRRPPHVVESTWAARTSGCASDPRGRPLRGPPGRLTAAGAGQTTGELTGAPAAAPENVHRDHSQAPHAARDSCTYRMS